MNKSTIIILLLFSLSVSSSASNRNQHMEKHSVNEGKNKMETRMDMSINSISFAGTTFNIVENGQSNRHYIWLHGDEKTAKLLLKKHIQSYQGKAFFIQNEDRDIKVHGLLLDPNRMYSRVGAERNIRKLNSNVSDSILTQLLRALDDERKIFFKSLTPPKGGVIIALHNNLRGYSIQDEMSKSDDVSIKNKEHPHHHDFYICTNKGDFDILAESPYNVVLQKQPRENDGSLSELAAKKGIRYINIETRLGYLSIQRNMLQYLVENVE